MSLVLKSTPIASSLWLATTLLATSSAFALTLDEDAVIESSQTFTEAVEADGVFSIGDGQPVNVRFDAGLMQWDTAPIMVSEGSSVHFEKDVSIGNLFLENANTVTVGGSANVDLAKLDLPQGATLTVDENAKFMVGDATSLEGTITNRGAMTLGTYQPHTRIENAGTVTIQQLTVDSTPFVVDAGHWEIQTMTRLSDVKFTGGRLVLGAPQNDEFLPLLDAALMEEPKVANNTLALAAPLNTVATETPDGFTFTKNVHWVLDGAMQDLGVKNLDWESGATIDVINFRDDTEFHVENFAQSALAKLKAGDTPTIRLVGYTNELGYEYHLKPVFEENGVTFTLETLTMKDTFPTSITPGLDGATFAPSSLVGDATVEGDNKDAWGSVINADIQKQPTKRAFDLSLATQLLSDTNFDRDTRVKMLDSITTLGVLTQSVDITKMNLDNTLTNLHTALNRRGGDQRQAWAQVFTSNEKTKTAKVEHYDVGHTTQMTGVTVGMDRPVKNARLGVALTHVSGTVKTNGQLMPSRSKVKSLGVTAYGYHWVTPKRQYRAMIHVGQSQMKTDMVYSDFPIPMEFDTKAKTQTVAVGFDARHQFEVKRFSIKPFVGVLVSRVKQKDQTIRHLDATVYTQKGKTFTFVDVPVGVNVTTRPSTVGNWSIAPEVDVAITKTFGDKTGTVTVTGDSGNVAHLNTTHVSSGLSQRLQAGLVMAYGKGLRVETRYTFKRGESSLTDHQLGITVKTLF